MLTRRLSSFRCWYVVLALVFGIVGLAPIAASAAAPADFSGTLAVHSTHAVDLWNSVTDGVTVANAERLPLESAARTTLLGANQESVRGEFGYWSHREFGPAPPVTLTPPIVAEYLHLISAVPTPVTGFDTAPVNATTTTDIASPPTPVACVNGNCATLELRPGGTQQTGWVLGLQGFLLATAASPTLTCTIGQRRRGHSRRSQGLRTLLFTRGTDTMTVMQYIAHAVTRCAHASVWAERSRALANGGVPRLRPTGCWLG